MNHDATHCLDYENEKCPRSCYRAELTEELEDREGLIGTPISWANFLNSRECPRRVFPVPEEGYL